MRVIIAGTRDFEDYEALKKVCDNILNVSSNSIQTEIISGACSTGKLTYVREDGTRVFGADGLGERYAAEHNFPCLYFPANWDAYKKQAGILRNIDMSKNADMLIAFWDGKSRGTHHMIKTAIKEGLFVFIYMEERVLTEHYFINNYL